MKITYCSTLKLSTFQSWFPIRKTKYFFSKQKGPSFASKFQLPNSVKSHVTRAPQQCEGCSTSSCAFTSWFCIQWLLSWWPWKKLPPKRSATIFCLLFCLLLLLLLLLLLPLLLCVLCCCKSGWCACFLAHTVWVFLLSKLNIQRLHLLAGNGHSTLGIQEKYNIGTRCCRKWPNVYFAQGHGG